jgi:phosphoribosyl-ATP pyrophosphohydrolase/phosphoribosyl-AMP cyclohydrolase
VSSAFDPLAVRYGPDGLVAAVIQDADDGRVLMVGWMDEEALAATITSGDVHFHSRSRDRLWRKGETSGNVLRLAGLALDCDGDTILVTADATGPTCHTGRRSCFDPEDDHSTADRTGRPGFAWLDELWSTIEDRARARPTGSYTATLLAGGVDATSRKVAEEATEVILAAKNDASAEVGGNDRAATRTALAAELADLLYHALVLSAERGLPASDIVTVLRGRHRPG